MVLQSISSMIIEAASRGPRARDHLIFIFSSHPGLSACIYARAAVQGCWAGCRTSSFAWISLWICLPIIGGQASHATWTTDAKASSRRPAVMWRGRPVDLAKHALRPAAFSFHLEARPILGTIGRQIKDRSVCTLLLHISPGRRKKRFAAWSVCLQYQRTAEQWAVKLVGDWSCCNWVVMTIRAYHVPVYMQLATAMDGWIVDLFRRPIIASYPAY